MPPDAPRQVAAAGYPLVNSSAHEAARLGKLQSLSDPITVRWFNELGVAPGWRCAELGAGAGSIATWLADRVGPGGEVTAVDRDTSQLADLAARPGVTVVQADLCTLELPGGHFDLVHTRAVLMHVPCPDRVVAEAVRALRPGGVAFFEETDGAPALEVPDPPGPYARVMVPMARRWSWARTLPALLESLGMTDVRDDVRQDPLVGGTPLAAFWRHTLETLAGLVDSAPDVSDMDGGDIEAMSALLEDPDFRIPFSARHRVTARKPG